LKLALNFKIAVVGKRVIRLIRERLYTDHVADTASGADGAPGRRTLLPMLPAEAEGLVQRSIRTIHVRMDQSCTSPMI